MVLDGLALLFLKCQADDGEDVRAVAADIRVHAGHIARVREHNLNYDLVNII